MNGLDLLYSWQSLFLAVIIATMTQSFKRLVETLIDKGHGGGEARRKASVLNTVLLPLFPLSLGALCGWLLPLRPEHLVQYVAETHSSSLVYVMWGASVGQFADYLYQRGKKFLIFSTHPEPEGDEEPRKSVEKLHGRKKPHGG